MFLAAMFAASMGAGFLKGIASSNRRQAAYDDKFEELGRKSETLNTSYNQATESYELAKTQDKAKLELDNAELTARSETTKQNRDRSLLQTQNAGSQQSIINAMQMATLAVDTERAVGQADQQAASSGFRGTGTARAAGEETREAGDWAMSQASAQSRLSNYQVHATALNNYTSADQQIDAYRRQQEYNVALHKQREARADLTMGQTKKTYNMQKRYIDEDLSYLETTGKSNLAFSQFTDVFGGVVGGAAKIFGSGLI